MSNINHPLHYNSLLAKCKCGVQIECIDVVRNMNFNLGNVVKYVWRAEHKGSVIENLKKARWYLDNEIERLAEECAIQSPGIDVTLGFVGKDLKKDPFRYE